MCSGKYIDIYFSLKITYPIIRLPEHIHSTIPNIHMDGGVCCNSKQVEAEQGSVTQKQHKHTYGG